LGDQRDYDIRLDDKYGSLALIDLRSEIAAHEPWFNQTLTTVNDAVVRLGILEGEFHPQSRRPSDGRGQPGKPEPRGYDRLGELAGRRLNVRPAG
jgi:hypothetical protein